VSTIVNFAISKNQVFSVLSHSYLTHAGISRISLPYPTMSKIFMQLMWFLNYDQKRKFVDILSRPGMEGFRGRSCFRM